MKQLLIFILTILSITGLNAHGHKNYNESNIFDELNNGDKLAILMVHFGTTHADTRSLTIDAINKLVKQQYPQTELREAYTSRIIIKRLNDRGTKKLNPLQSLEQLKKDGYTHIIIQATNIINGVEMESLHKDVDNMQSHFKDIRIGDPLLYSPEDYNKVIDILTQDNAPQKAYVWVGHGTYDPSTAQYAMIDYMLKAKGFNNHFVGTIEGYPEYDDMLIQLKQSGLKQVVLVPFMFVAGEHAKNDIAGDWKEQLEENGFTVSVKMEGLGQNPLIQQLFLSHLQFIIEHKKIDIMKKKAIYQVTGEKLQ